MLLLCCIEIEDWSLFCNLVPCVLSSLSIILKRKRGLVPLLLSVLLLSCCCRCFASIPRGERGGLRYM